MSLGALLEDGRRLDEAMAERLYGRVDALRDTEPDVSRSLRRVLASWPRAIVARRIIEELRGGPPEVEIVTAALRQRETIAGHAPDLLRELTAAGGYPGGVAAVLLGDAGISARILAGGDREAAAGLLASARLVRVPLPVQAVARLLQSGGPLLVRAAESYLVAEDSSAAREIVLSRHPGEMIILGARSDHDPGHFSFDHLDDSSRHLVTTMRRKDGPDEIIALLSAGYFGDEGQATILVKGGKAQFLLRPDGTRYRQRPLEDDEWQDLRRFMEESRIFDLPPLMTSVLDGIQYEAVRLTRDGGRRVFMNNPGDDGSAGSPYHLFVRRFKKLARAVSTPLQYDIFDAVAGARRAFSGKERALAVWGNQEAVLVLTGEGDTMTWRLLGQRKLGAEVERPAEWPDEELAAMNEAFLLHPHLNPSPWQARLGEGVVLAGLLKESRTYSPALRLFKVAGGSEVLSEGTYASPIVTPDGRWLVAARAGRGGWAQPNGVVRIRVEDREVLPVDLPAADTLDPVAWVPDRSAVLLRRETEEDGAGPGSAEFHLLDPITGATERVEGEFEPWFHARAHPLQPTGKPHEAWVALPGADETRVGRYETSSFSFTTAATYPRFPFTSDRMWVDAAGETVYVVNEGDLLALPFAP